MLLTDAPASAGGAAYAAPAGRPTKPTPRSKPARTSPRLTRTHISMRYAPLPLIAAPSGGLLASISLTFIRLKILILRVFLPRPDPLHNSPPPISPPRVPPTQATSRGRQVNYVVESCKYHQHQDDCEADPKPDLLGAFRQRPAAQGFDQIEQKVTAIEQRYREQVQKPDRDRQHGRQMNERDEARGGHLARHLGNPDRAAELVGRLAADDDAADIAERAVDDEPGLLHAHPHRLRRRHRLEFQVLRRGRPGNAQNADAMHVAEIVLDLLERRRRFEHQLRTLAVDGDIERLAGAVADHALHVGEVADGAAVDRHHQVARLKSGRGGGAVRLHRIHTGGHGLLAVKHEDAGKDHYGQKEIGHRSGHHDGRAFGHRLEHETLRFLAFIHGGQALGVRHARGILIAEEFYIAAERDGGDFPARAVAVVKADDFGAKTNGKHQDPHATPARDQEMTQFVEEHDQAEDEQKGHDVTDHAAPKRM